MFCLKCLDEETICRMGPQVGELGRQHLKAILLDRKTLCRNWLASVWIQAESCSQSRQGTLPQLFRKALEETSTLQCKHWQGVIHDSAFCCNSRNLCANVALLKRHSTWKKQVPAASLPCVYFYGCFQKNNRGTPKSSILIGFSFINHPFWDTPNFWKHPYGDA